MLCEVEVRAMRDTFQLAESGRREREAVLDVARAGTLASVVRELVLVMLPQLQICTREPQALPPAHALVAPEGIPIPRSARMAEELDFHLLEFAAAEGEVARRDLVAKRLSDLRD